MSRWLRESINVHDHPLEHGLLVLQNAHQVAHHRSTRWHNREPLRFHVSHIAHLLDQCADFHVRRTNHLRFDT